MNTSTKSVIRRSTLKRLRVAPVRVIWVDALRCSRAFVVLSMVVGPGAAFAATTQWIAGGSSWNTATNWSAGLPDLTIDATIANGGTAVVSHVQFPGIPDAVAKTVTLGMNGHSGRLDLNGGWLQIANDITVGEFGGTGTLDLGGQFISRSQLNSRAAYIGRTFASRGDVVVDNYLWINSSEVVVGTDTVGTLTIQDKG